jgi:predicted GH43/DUF377 family glycosyl hydrolase
MKTMIRCLLLISHRNKKEKVMKNLLTLCFLMAVLMLGAGQADGQFVWTKDVRNPILSGGASGAWNRQLMAPSVLYNTDSARYEMWFNASAAVSSTTWYPYRIGFAFSKDGANWTVNPSAVLSPDAGTWDAYTVDLPTVIRENGQYKMWYIGRATGTSTTFLGFATSPDGINWTKYSGNPVMGPGKAAWEAGGPYGTTMMPSSGGYKMWYTGNSVNNTAANIGYAVSTDGINWQRDTVNNPVLKTGAAGQWDDTYACFPRVLQIGKTYFMWYSGGQAGGNPPSIGTATSNDSGITWTKYASNPVLGPSQNQWDGSYVDAAAVLLRGDTLHMWYTGGLIPTLTNLWRIGHATSPFVPVGIAERGVEVPHDFTLTQNYPNPFNPSTTIRYSLPSSANVKLAVYDLLGREIATLVNEEQSAGWKEVEWNAGGVSSGIYFYKLQAGNFVETKKMLIVK